MSRRVQIEEDSDSDAGFDDDTDLPLPGASSLPNTGTKGAILEEINIEQEKTLPPEAPRRAPPPSSSRPSGSGSGAGAGRTGGGGEGLMDPSHPLYQQFLEANRAAGGGRAPQMVDMSNPAAMEKYKRWTCVYPIYIDAKRAYAVGQRRISRDKAVWWPKSDEITTAAASLQLPVLHEADKFHPRDWENPGRVKVQWKQDDGRLTNPAIKTKKQLLERIAAHIQRTKPAQIPDLSSLSLADDATPEPEPLKSTKAKGKKPAPYSSTTKKRRHPPMPKPPQPWPALQDRYTFLSPIIPSGSLLEGWKVGTGDKAPGEAGAPGTPGQGGPGGGGPGGMGKGKRKIIRIRQ